jgi:hypothetical protein
MDAKLANLAYEGTEATYHRGLGTYGWMLDTELDMKPSNISKS